MVSLSDGEMADLRELAVRKGHSHLRDWARVVLLRELTLEEWAQESAMDTPPDGPEGAG